MQLRPYQTLLIDQTRRALRVHRSVLLQAPTGAGKTALSAFMLREAAERGKTCWFVVHRRELIEQTSRTLDRFGAVHGFVAAGFPPARRQPILVCSVQSLARRLEYLTPPDLVIWDEAHHCAAGTWAKVRHACPSAYHVGLTATPERLDGRGLEDAFAALVPGPSVSWLIEQGFLAPYRIWSHPVPDLQGVSLRGQDFDGAALGAAMSQAHVVGDCVRHYQAICPGAQAVAFCASVHHARAVRDAFISAGIHAAELDAGINARDRKQTIAAFRRGEIRVLTSIDLFGEGFDLPELEAAILLRPTQSLGLYLQQVGRALRAAPGKELAIILDHAGNAVRHGLPDDAREWSLMGRKQRAGAAKTKLCPNCFGAAPAGARRCPSCNGPFPIVQNPRNIGLLAGELEEIDPDALRAAQRAEVTAARDRASLEAIATRRGYRPGWVEHILQARRSHGARP